MGTVIRSLEHAKILGPAAVEAWLAHMGGPGAPKPAPAVAPQPKSEEPKDGMNGLERRFWGRLQGAVPKWFDDVRREPMSLRLAGRTRYTPDFMALHAGDLIFWEVKGFMRDDAAVKLKVAKGLYPFFSFVLVTREKGVWLCRGVAEYGGISRDVWTPDWLR